MMVLAKLKLQLCAGLWGTRGKAIDGNSSIIMWLDDVQCTLMNADLKDCKHRPWGSHNCGGAEAVGVECFSFPEDARAARLVSTTNTPGKGILELYYGGQWGRVYYSGFGVEEATVACRMLGHNTIGAQVSFSSNTGNGSRSAIVEQVHCLGSELTLNDCIHYPWGRVTSSSIVVRIQCPNAYLQIRLNSTTPGRGRVEVLHNNVWGTVCRGSSFSSQEAQVVCRMANQPWTTAFVTTSYGPGEGFIWLSNVDCTGTETSIDECSHSSWGTAPGCYHSSDVGVVCGGDSVSIHLEPPGSVLKVLLGQQISVKCVVDYSNSSVTSFRWTHNGRSYSGQTFSRTMMLKSDAGSLTCNVANVRASTRINVWYPPEVHLEPRNHTIDVAVGEDLRVQCVVDDANPNVHTFRWTHNGRTSKGPIFLKRNITKSDQGQLTCTADNSPRMASGRADATVNVRYPPKIHLEPNQQVINVKRGGDVTVVCVVDEASPSVTSYTWSHNTHISHGAVFTKHDLSTSDAGHLSCSATNGQGTSSVGTEIIVNASHPSSVTVNDKVTTIATGSAALVIILLLIIIIIYQRRRMKTAKPIDNPQRMAQTQRTNDGEREEQYESVELASRGAENTYCTFGMMPKKVDGSDRVYCNQAFEDEENTQKDTETASRPSYGDIQLELTDNIQNLRAKKRQVQSPKTQTHDNEPVYENTIVRR